MAEKEVMLLIGDFRPDVLERWKQFAEATNRVVEHHVTFDCIKGREGMLIILDEHGINHLPL